MSAKKHRPYGRQQLTYWLPRNEQGPWFSSLLLDLVALKTHSLQCPGDVPREHRRRFCLQWPSVRAMRPRAAAAELCATDSGNTL